MSNPKWVHTHDTQTGDTNNNPCEYKLRGDTQTTTNIQDKRTPDTQTSKTCETKAKKQSPKGHLAYKQIFKKRSSVNIILL